MLKMKKILELSVCVCVCVCVCVWGGGEILKICWNFASKGGEGFSRTGFSGGSSWYSIGKKILMSLSLLTIVCYKIIAQIKYEMICIVILLIVLMVIIAVWIIHANNKNSAWYFYLSDNVNKHVFQIIS